jgi:hypothetical protein
VHTCPRSLQRELAHVFSGSGIDLTGCLAVPTNQHADTDLVNVGQPVEAEKDRLLNVVSALMVKTAMCHIRIMTAWLVKCAHAPQASAYSSELANSRGYHRASLTSDLLHLPLPYKSLLYSLWTLLQRSVTS